MQSVSIFNRVFNLYVVAIFFNLVNFVVFGLVIAASIICILKQVVNVVVINSFSGAASLLLLTNEFYCTSITTDYFRFLITYRGRGLLYLLLGFIVYQQGLNFNIFVTYFSVAVGVLYFVFSFLPHLLPLNDLRSNYRGYLGHLDDLEDGIDLDSSQPNMESPNLVQDDSANTIRPARRITKRSALDLEGGKLLPRQSRARANKLPSIKGQATLVMEINAALGDFDYSDFDSGHASGSPSVTKVNSKTTFPNSTPGSDVNISTKASPLNNYLQTSPPIPSSSASPFLRSNLELPISDQPPSTNSSSIISANSEPESDTSEEVIFDRSTLRKSHKPSLRK